MLLRWFRGERDIPGLGRDHQVSRATAYRYIDEGIAVLAAQAPDLHEALEHAPGRRPRLPDHGRDTADARDTAAGRPVRPVDHQRQGRTDRSVVLRQDPPAPANVQALSSLAGLPLWVSDVEPGSAHDLTPARAHLLGALYAAVVQGLSTLADGGYEGAGIGVLTPVKNPADGQTLSIDNRTNKPAPTRPALPRRTRICPAQRPLAHPPAHHHQPQQNRRHHPRRTRPHPFRIRPPPRNSLRSPQGDAGSSPVLFGFANIWWFWVGLVVGVVGWRWGRRVGQRAGGACPTKCCTQGPQRLRSQGWDGVPSRSDAEGALDFGGAAPYAAPPPPHGYELPSSVQRPRKRPRKRSGEADKGVGRGRDRGPVRGTTWPSRGGVGFAHDVLVRPGLGCPNAGRRRASGVGTSGRVSVSWSRLLCCGTSPSGTRIRIERGGYENQRKMGFPEGFRGWSSAVVRRSFRWRHPWPRARRVPVAISKSSRDSTTNARTAAAPGTVMSVSPSAAVLRSGSMETPR